MAVLGKGRGRGRKSGKNPRGSHYAPRRNPGYTGKLVGENGPHVRPCGNIACKECYVDFWARRKGH